MELHRRRFVPERETLAINDQRVSEKEKTGLKWLKGVNI